jgi:general secretion pathway protein E
VPADAAVAALLHIKEGTTVYRPGGCEACNGTGYLGRMGVFEVVRVTDEIRKFVLAGDEAGLAAAAFRENPALEGAARQAVLDGLTVAEEAIRVSRGQAVDA